MSAPPPQDYRGVERPGAWGVKGSVGAHTHDHGGLGGLADDDHTIYLRAPRAQLRVVAPSGAPYTDPETAIEACSAGDVVLMLADTYALAGTVTIPNNDITIMGGGATGTVLASAQSPAFDLNGKDGLVFRDFGVSYTGTGNIFDDTQATSEDCLFENLRIASGGCNRAWDLPSGTARITIFGCYLTGAPTGYVVLSNGDYFLFARNRIDVTTDCDLVSPRGEGDRVLDNILRSSVVNWAGNGIIAYNPQYQLISGNLVEVVTSSAAALNGIYALVASGDCYGLRIFGNDVIGDSDVGTGIKLAAQAGCTLRDSLASDNYLRNWDEGIKLTSARVHDTLLHDNSVHTCATTITDSGTNTDSQDNY